MSSRATGSARATATILSQALLDLFESIHEGIYIGTLKDGADVTIAVNPHLKLMFGHPPDENNETIRPFEPTRFVDPQDRTAFFERLQRDGTVSDYLLRLRRADDTPFWVEVTANIDSDLGTAVRPLAALIRDVSERRRIADQGRDIHRQVAQAEKLAALGQTVSGVAHELNNPLATILTWSERLADRPLDDVTKRGIETILSESLRATKIVRNLLTFSRKRHTTRSMVDLNQVVRETLSLRTYEQRVSNITTINALATGLPQVFADPHHLKQVLLNLIINAEQAMLSAHGRGTLITRTWYNSEQDTVVLELNDDGPGLSEDVKTKIFDPFFTTKDVGKGTGLGLTVAYAIMQDHGGQIRVQSESGHGASFFIDLPASSNVSHPRTEQIPQQIDESRDQTATVLVVEDEPALAAALSEALTDAGFRVDHAGDGQAALERVDETNYDLVVCDLKMPRMDGPTFYRTIIETKPSLARRILFVTGDVAGTDAERFLEDSGCRWLAKPFRLGELLAVARELLN